MECCPRCCSRGRIKPRGGRAGRAAGWLWRRVRGPFSVLFARPLMSAQIVAFFFQPGLVTACMIAVAAIFESAARVVAMASLSVWLHGRAAGRFLQDFARTEFSRVDAPWATVLHQIRDDVAPQWKRAASADSDVDIFVCRTPDGHPMPLCPAVYQCINRTFVFLDHAPDRMSPWFRFQVFYSYGRATSIIAGMVEKRGAQLTWLSFAVWVCLLADWSRTSIPLLLIAVFAQWVILRRWDTDRDEEMSLDTPSTWLSGRHVIDSIPDEEVTSAAEVLRAYDLPHRFGDTEDKDFLASRLVGALDRRLNLQSAAPPIPRPMDPRVRTAVVNALSGLALGFAGQQLAGWRLITALGVAGAMIIFLALSLFTAAVVREQTIEVLRRRTVEERPAATAV